MRTLAELQSMPTLAVGQTCNLKIDRGNRRVWLSRMTVADGAPYDDQVTVEILDRGRWVILDQYQAAR